MENEEDGSAWQSMRMHFQEGTGFARKVEEEGGQRGELTDLSDHVFIWEYDRQHSRPG